MEKHNDQLFLESLGLISRIELRHFPEGAKMYHFGEDFKSDIRKIKALCRKRSPVAYGSRHLNVKWDIVTLLSPEYYLFYLPSILLACLAQPSGSLAWIVVKKRSPTRINYTAYEESAYWSVVSYIEQCSPREVEDFT